MSIQVGFFPGAYSFGKFERSFLFLLLLFIKLQIILSILFDKSINLCEKASKFTKKKKLLDQEHMKPRCWEIRAKLFNGS